MLEKKFEMADENNVLFVRGNGNESNSDSDVWDDTALIKAYDKAVNLAKEEVAQRMGMEIEDTQVKQKSHNFKQSQNANKTYKKWTVGKPCRAVYSEDGEIYEAIISKIFENTETCIVKFVGYGNTEKVALGSLLESNGLESQIAQKKDADKFQESNGESNHSNFLHNQNSKTYNGTSGEKMDCESEETKHFKNFLPGSSFNSALDMMPPAPPLPPQLMAKLPENDADALSSMLMSWYISGFHTGYYHGLKQARRNQEKRKNC